MALKRILYDRCWAYLAALCLALPLTANADFATRDAININISNDSTYAITGDGTSTISTLAGDMPDNAWQNTPAGNPVVSGDQRNGRVTGITAYDAASNAATNLSDVIFAWAVEGSGVLNYGNADIDGNPIFQKAWLARYNQQSETSSILVQSIPYRKYDVIVYCSGADESAFGAITVNGIPYVGDMSLDTATKTKVAESSSATWGGRLMNPTLGQNAIMVTGLENPELSLVISSGATSICAVQILRDMSESVWPTQKKTISINIQSAKDSNGSTPSIYGLEPVPSYAWTNDGLSLVDNNANYDSDVDVNIIQWDGSATNTLADVTLHEKVKNAYHWSGYNYSPQNQILSGYADDTDHRAQITVTKIPYAVYDVIVYCATDTNNRYFGPVTVNGTPYRWDEVVGKTVVADSADSTESTRWGWCHSRVPEYGRNALRISNQTSKTLSIIGANNSNSARGGIAAIQIVETPLEIGENDLEIAVDGDTAHTVTAAEAEKKGTVYLTGSGTLTLSGDAKISAATIDVGKDVVLNVNADRLDATTFTGLGTVVYDGTKPVADKGWTNSWNWSGTVWVKNIATTSNERKDWDLALYGNANSTLRFTDVNLFFKSATTGNVFAGTVDIDGAGMNVCDGYGGSIATIARLTGSGTLSTNGGSSSGNGLTINDASGFTGTITLTKYKVIFGTSTGTSASGVLEIETGNSVTVAGATAPGGFVVNGTLVAKDALASSASAAVTGAGTVVFDGMAPSPTGDAWWKNAAWTGTVEIKNHNFSANIELGTYGNSGSKVCMNGSEAYIAVLNNPNHNIEEFIIGDGGFTQDGGYSSGNINITIPCKVTGTGNYSLAATGNANKTLYLTGDLSSFKGALMTAGVNNRIVLGATTRSFMANTLVVGSGKVLNFAKNNTEAPSGGLFIDNGGQVGFVDAGFVWTAGGITVDGLFKATARTQWGGGTPMLLGNTGVLELTSAGNTDARAVDFLNVTGTGTIRFNGNGYYALPAGDKIFSSTLSIELEQAAGVVASDTKVIGSISGSKNMRSDLDAYNKTLTIKQAKDGVWSGSFNGGGDDRLATVVVDPGASTTGTLTLAGNYEFEDALTVNGSVNLTGSWNGNATVSGTFAGTGTLKGSLTFADGAAFKAAATPLTVSGGVTVPVDAKVTIDISDITSEFTDDLKQVKIINAAGCDAKKFTLSAEYLALGYKVVALTDALYITKGDSSGGSDDVMLVCATNVLHTIVTVSFAGTTYTSTNLDSGYWVFELPYDKINANPDELIKVEYTPEPGYVIVGTTIYEIPPADELYIDTTLESIQSQSESSSGGNVFDTEGKGADDLPGIVAVVSSSTGVNTTYETLDAAFNAVETGETVTLVTDANLSAAFTVTNDLTIAGITSCVMGGWLSLTNATLTLSNDLVVFENPIHVLSIEAKLVFPTNYELNVTCEQGFSPTTEDVGANTIMTFVEIVEGSFDAWAEEKGIEGAWNESTGGIPNVLRYVFDEPTETFLTISSIIRNADGSVTITTPPVVNTDGFNVYIVASEDLALDDGDLKIAPTDDAKESGRWVISAPETELAARFFWLSVEEASEATED